VIEEYEFGRIIIQGKVYTSDVIVHKNGVEEGWWRKEGHKVCMDDIKRVIDLNPEIVVFGTGAYGRVKVEDNVIEYLKRKGIDVYALETKEAIKLFESLLKQGKNVVLAAHLTC